MNSFWPVPTHACILAIVCIYVLSAVLGACMRLVSGHLGVHVYIKPFRESLMYTVHCIRNKSEPTFCVSKYIVYLIPHDVYEF